MTDISKKTPSVAVGISTYNRAGILRKSIGSALDQSHELLRVLVIDDASTDGTQALRQEFPTVFWERRDSNQGYVRARNTMMLAATEDYFVSLDDDAWFLEGDEIAVVVDYLEAHPNVAAVAFDILSPDRPCAVGRGKKSSVSLFIGCGHVLRLDVVKAMAGYKTFPGSYGVEEKDLCLRLIDAGYEIVELAGVHVWHDKATTARNTPLQHRSGVCNDLTLTVWRFPAVMVLQTLVWKTAAHLVFALKYGLLRPYMQGMLDFARTAANAWRDRGPVRSASIARFRLLSKSPQEIDG